MKGHVAKRQAEWRRMGLHSAVDSGRANVAGWKQLAQMSRKVGAPVQAGGEQIVH